MLQCEPGMLIKGPSTRAIRLTFSYDGEKVTLLGQQRVEMIVPGSDPVLNEGPLLGCWLDLKDVQGRLLFRRAIHNPLLSSVEIFGQDQGRNIVRKSVDSAKGLFVVLLPDTEQIDHVVLNISGEDSGGQQFREKEIGCFPLTK